MSDGRSPLSEGMIDVAQIPKSLFNGFQDSVAPMLAPNLAMATRA
jgi:hypothetical protein